MRKPKKIELKYALKSNQKKTEMFANLPIEFALHSRLIWISLSFSTILFVYSVLYIHVCSRSFTF